MKKVKFAPGDIVEVIGKVSAWPLEGKVGVYVRKSKLAGHVINVPHLGGTKMTTVVRIRHVEPNALPQAREYLARWGLVAGANEEKP